jgi:peptide/nickel transport system ATP-binding protein
MAADGQGGVLAGGAMAPPSDPPLVEISGLTVAFEAGRRRFRALHGIDLAVDRGEAVGLVGESGCGKSITWLAVLGLLGANATVGGEARLDGVNLIGAPAQTLEMARGGRIAMIFQDPSSHLNPVHRIGRQLTEALRLHRGMDDRGARAEARRLLDHVGIADAARRLEEYPHQLSGGMNQRVMIAIALAGRPELLIADEPTTALDATIQAQILELLAQLRRETGMAMVLISHDLGAVAETVDRVAVMYAGRVIEEAPTERLFEAPGHPYARGLIGALPVLDGPRHPLSAIPGSVPEPWRLPPGCPFQPRCDAAEAACAASVPALAAIGPRHRAACFRARPIQAARPACPASADRFAAQ